VRQAGFVGSVKTDFLIARSSKYFAQNLEEFAAATGLAAQRLAAI
jgi:hypothetical protein